LVGLKIIAFQNAANALKADIVPDIDDLNMRSKNQKRSAWKMALMNPLAVRVKLFNPNQILDSLSRYLGRFFNPGLLFAWLVIVGLGILLTIYHWQELSHTFSENILRPSNIILLMLIYPMVKLLHEIGHGLVAKKWGADIPELGIMWMVFMPLPYVNASSATAFRNKWHRVLVDSAGIMVELCLASLALFIWLLIEPGLIRDMAFSTMVIGGISTVLFNGNPLLRYDGYYILSDITEFPNLAKRSNAYFWYLLKKFIFHIEGKNPARNRAERIWFLSYSIASFCYRMFILFFIASFLIHHFFILGIALASWAMISQVLIPAFKHLDVARKNPQYLEKRKDILKRQLIYSFTIAIIVFVIPIPFHTTAEGIVWVPDKAVIRAAQDGFVKQFYITKNDMVKEGQVILQLHNPELDSEYAITKAKLSALSVKESEALSKSDQSTLQSIHKEQAQLKEEEQRLQQKIQSLAVKTHANGLFLTNHHDDLQGSYVTKGTLIGFIRNDEQLRARVLINQDNIGLFQRKIKQVDIRFADNISKIYRVELVRQIPQASNQLPSSAFGVSGGGAIAIDASDENGITAVEQYFQVEVSLPTDQKNVPIGQRIYVRFHHGYGSLASHIILRVKQLFLSHFNV
jgi:putative peptide zinc metalloprotease protein